MFALSTAVRWKCAVALTFPRAPPPPWPPAASPSIPRKASDSAAGMIRRPKATATAPIVAA